MAEKNFTAIGQEILQNSRNELYMALPYMEQALCELRFTPGDEVTPTIATNGVELFYSGHYLAERYLRGNKSVNRVYLHIVLHCLLRHLAKKKGTKSELWDLSCDVAVESILDSLEYSCLAVPLPPVRQKFYSECLSEMKVLTAEGIYRKLRKERRSEFEIAQLQRVFVADDHGLWDMDGEDRKEQSEQQDKNWQDLSAKTQTEMETVLSSQAKGGETVLEQVRVSARDDVDYRAFLRRFAAPREIMKADDDAFDPIFYTYGLQHYGNMPLIEPPETKEEKRIEDLVIAIDTSMSTSGELVRAFLSCTYSILRSTETFTRKLNIHVIQCDDQVRSDTKITSMDQLKEYMNHVELSGGSATDFRPVFEHIARLQKEGSFANLRGLIYFTDGMGIYPKKRPAYETAFVLLEEPPLSFKMPAWCIRLLLNIPELERTTEPTEEMVEDEIKEYLAELPDL